MYKSYLFVLRVNRLPRVARLNAARLHAIIHRGKKAKLYYGCCCAVIIAAVVVTAAALGGYQNIFGRGETCIVHNNLYFNHGYSRYRARGAGFMAHYPRRALVSPLRVHRDLPKFNYL